MECNYEKDEINDEDLLLKLVTTKDDVSFDKASVSFNKSYKPDFELKIGISVEITILPEIRESKPVQVTAVKIEKLKDTDMGQYRKITGEKAQEMIDYITKIKKDGDTVGGVVTCVIQNVPVGLGDPVFDKLHADLGKAMLSINAVKGFEYGSGFEGCKLRGSEHNDLFNADGTTQTNRSGGIQGGISNGMDIVFRVAFKPVATIMQKQSSINNRNEEIVLEAKGRHDPCVVPRAVPIVEAMAALDLADAWLVNKTVRKYS